MTESELKALLNTLSPKGLQDTLAQAGAGSQQQFVDYNRAKLLAKYSATSGEGRAIRDAYELIDEGVDPVDVAQRVIAAQAEYDITPESMNEITGAIGDYAVASSKFARENPVKTPVEALKDLGMSELAPLLPYIDTATKPVGLKDIQGDVSFQRVGEKAKLKAEDLSKQLLALRQQQSEPGGASVAKNFMLDPMRILAGPVAGLLAAPYFLGRAKKKAVKEKLDVISGDKASSPFTIEQLKEQQKLLASKQEQERQQRIAEEGLRYQERMNKSYNKAYLEELARLAKAREGKPTAFDVQRAAMLRSLNG